MSVLPVVVRFNSANVDVTPVLTLVGQTFLFVHLAGPDQQSSTKHWSLTYRTHNDRTAPGVCPFSFARSVVVDSSRVSAPPVVVPTRSANWDRQECPPDPIGSNEAGGQVCPTGCCSIQFGQCRRDTCTNTGRTNILVCPLCNCRTDRNVYPTSRCSHSVNQLGQTRMSVLPVVVRFNSANVDVTPGLTLKEGSFQ